MSRHQKFVLFSLLVIASLTTSLHILLAAPAVSYVTSSGSSLLYRGQTITLHGENFNNLPALGANIGSGNITDINLNEADYEQLRVLGGNSVRFGMSFGWYLSNRTQFFQVVDQHVAWAKAHRLWMILLTFTTPNNCYEGYSKVCGIWTNSNEQNQLLNFWVDIASHYQNEPTVIGYDLLNEPTAPSISAQWFPLAQNIRNAVTAVDPNHFVFVESGANANFAGKLNGSNIIYSVHDYAPGSLALSSSGSYPYPGNAPDWDGRTVMWNKAAFSGQGDPRANLRQRLAIDWAQQNNVPLYIGEWGTRNIYSGYDTYIQDHFALFNAWGINYAHYVWRHNTSYWSVYPMHGSLVTNDVKME